MMLNNGDVGLQLELYIILFFNVSYRHLFLLFSLGGIILYAFVFFRNWIIFDMFGGESEWVGVIKYLLSLMFSALQVESKCLIEKISL